MVKAIFFDLDDTLIHTLETKARAIQYTARKYYNEEIATEIIRAAWGKPFRELMAELFPKGANIDEVVAHYTSERDNFPTPVYPGTIETLKTLSGRAQLGIVTSHTRMYIHKDLAVAGIPEDLFFLIQTAEDTEHHKPDPRVFDPAIASCSKRGIERSDMLYVGDNLIDYHAAVDAGIGFVAIHGHTTPKEVFEKLEIRTVSDIKELVTI